jgi:hypothetical protein
MIAPISIPYIKPGKKEKNGPEQEDMPSSHLSCITAIINYERTIKR